MKLSEFPGASHPEPSPGFYPGLSRREKVYSTLRPSAELIAHSSNICYNLYPTLRMSNA